jgi:hypothetical protein
MSIQSEKVLSLSDGTPTTRVGIPKKCDFKDKCVVSKQKGEELAGKLENIFQFDRQASRLN